MRRGWRIAAALHSSQAFLGLLLVFAFSVLASPMDRAGQRVFLDPGNLSNITRQVAENGILSVGMTVVILTGGIDLSVGSLMALGATLTAMLIMERQWTLASQMAAAALALCAGAGAMAAVGALARRRRFRLLAAMAAGLAAGAAAYAFGARQVPTGFTVAAAALAVLATGILLGATNGAIAAKGKLQPFVVTLAMMSAGLGLARLSSGGAARDVGFETEAAGAHFRLLYEPVANYFPMPALIFLAAAIVTHILLWRTRFGRYVYALGGNEEAARLSGVFVDRVKIAAYALSGGLAAMTGIIHCAQNRQGNPNDGIGLELDAIAAVVIGGTSLTGGRGGVPGTIVGVLIIGILNNIMSLRDVNTNFQLILKGVIIVATVLIQEGRLRLPAPSLVRERKELP